MPYTYLYTPYILSIYTYSKAMLILIPCGITLGLLIILAYDLLKKDWFLIEETKENMELGKDSELAIGRIVKWIITKLGLWEFRKKIALVAFFLWDPTFTLWYYRKGSFRYNGIPNLKAFWLFLASAVVSTIGVSVIWSGILYLVHLMVAQFT